MQQYDPKPVEVVNNLTTNDANKALSAAQGKALSEQITNIPGIESKLIQMNYLSAGEYRREKSLIPGIPLSATVGGGWYCSNPIISGDYIQVGIFDFQSDGKLQLLGTSTYNVTIYYWPTNS